MDSSSEEISEWMSSSSALMESILSERESAAGTKGAILDRVLDTSFSDADIETSSPSRSCPAFIRESLISSAFARIFCSCSSSSSSPSRSLASSSCLNISSLKSLSIARRASFSSVSARLRRSACSCFQSRSHSPFSCDAPA